MASLIDLAQQDAEQSGPGVKCGFHAWWAQLEPDMQQQVRELIAADSIPSASRFRVLANAGCPLGQKQINRHLTAKDPCRRCVPFGIQNLGDDTP